MVALPNDCPPLDGIGACSALPLAFVRLRYFFGKRLGVADFVDQQLYHAAKMRFHNQHLHGAGVACGLRLSLFGGDPNVVRVAKGAAVDRCGREIVVGVDQCIDVNAWIAKQVAADSHWADNNVDPTSKQVTLCAVLRYTECTSSPEPAPRDPCSCEDGGCEFGRIREGFELDLRTQAQATEFIAATAFPAADAITDAVARSISGPSLDARLAEKVSAQPPDPTGEDWLVVGCFTVTLKQDANNAWIVDTGAANPLVFLDPSAPILLETAAMQDLLLRALGASYQPGALLDTAPQIAKAEMGTIANQTPFTLTLTGDVVPATIVVGSIKLSFFDPTAAQPWKAVGAGVGTVTYTAESGTAPATVAFKIDNGGGDLKAAAAGATRAYRLVVGSDPATPIVDAKMRPLLPIGFAWDFLVDENGKVAGGPFA